MDGSGGLGGGDRGQQWASYQLVELVYTANLVYRPKELRQCSFEPHSTLNGELQKTNNERLLYTVQTENYSPKATK
jgi:hypothetical protein